MGREEGREGGRKGGREKRGTSATKLIGQEGTNGTKRRSGVEWGNVGLYCTPTR